MIANILGALGFLSSFLIPLYLIFRASYKGFFKDYAVLYIYLMAFVLADGTRWMARGLLGAESRVCYAAYQMHSFIYHVPTLPLVILKFFLICWLFWIILSNDYPSIRFGFVLIFLATTFVFLLTLAVPPDLNPSTTPQFGCAHEEDPQLHHDGSPQLERINLQLRHFNQRMEYFNMASLLLMAVLSIIIFVFQLPVGENLKGIVLGLSANLILGIVYDGLRLLSKSDVDKIKMLNSFHFVPLLVMLLIFCRYLSSRKVSESLCINERLKHYDGKVSEFLVKTRLYNAFTNRYFFKYFLFEGNPAGQQAFFENYRKRLKQALASPGQAGPSLRSPGFTPPKASSLFKSKNGSMS